MKSMYLSKKSSRFLQLKVILFSFVSIINICNGYPLTNDDGIIIGIPLTKTNHSSIIYDFNRTTDNTIQRSYDKNDGRVGLLDLNEGYSRKFISPHSEIYKTTTPTTTTTPITKQDQTGEDEKNLPTCILGSAQTYLFWWVNEDGSLRDKLAENNAFAGDVLDLSLTERTEDSLLNHVWRLKVNNRTDNVVFMSVAQNGLDAIPRTTLILVQLTLQYLSMSGNKFSSKSLSNGVLSILTGWATFPEMLHLVELDLRNCSIEYLAEDTFRNVPNLKKLYLSYNNFNNVPSDIFSNFRMLVHLDMSYQNIIPSTPNSYYPADPYAVISEGLLLPERLFYKLQNLIFLDLSHTKLVPTSVKAFTLLGPSMQQLSLCYTNLPIVVKKMFGFTSLKVLDISGNPGLTPMIQEDSFHGLEDTLEILAFSNSNLKHLNFIQDMVNLKVLQLNDNNINQLSNETFSKLEKLEIIDFSSNHIGNWYSQAFLFNSNLRVLNLRDNNINLLTADMMTDFSIVDYLAIGNNNFICNCMLREFIELAAKNTRLANCTYGDEVTTEPPVTQIPLPFFQSLSNELVGRLHILYDTQHNYDIVSRIFNQYDEFVIKSNEKIRESSEKYGMYWNLILYSKTKKQQIGSMSKTFVNRESTVYCNETHFSREHHFNSGNNSIDLRLNFTFRLLDYNENDYVCIHSENSTEHHFVELEYCNHNRMSWPNFIERFQSNSIGLGTLMLILVVFAFILLVYYHKWWDIRYIYLLVKNATILSRLNKEKEEFKNGSKVVQAVNTNFNYDVFVSYSEPDREWIMNEFLPNIESGHGVNICLHERDFQVGLSILENIISCMDRSRCILLVISESFIVSHWCQFEMHLAQHRLLETKREQMILVLLENIPKGKRPKTLQFLMKTKTYIVWPTKKNPVVKMKEKSKTKHFDDEGKTKDTKSKSKSLLDEERKLFWRRLKKALVSASWESDKLSF